MQEFNGVFVLFPVRKKVRGWVRTRGHNWVRTLLHGLRRLMPSPWRAPTTWWRSRRRWRCPWRRWRWRTQRLALQLVSGPCGSACSSSSTSWDGPGGGVPMVIGAPSHTRGLSFTRKLQPMSCSLPCTFLAEDVVAASGPGGCRLAVAGGTGGGRGGWRLVSC